MLFKTQTKNKINENHLFYVNWWLWLIGKCLQLWFISCTTRSRKRASASRKRQGIAITRQQWKLAVSWRWTPSSTLTCNLAFALHTLTVDARTAWPFDFQPCTTEHQGGISNSRLVESEPGYTQCTDNSDEIISWNHHTMTKGKSKFVPLFINWNAQLKWNLNF